MRQFVLTIVFAATVAFALTGCQSAPTTSGRSPASSSNDAIAPGAKSDLPVATLIVHGMACPQCSYNVDLQLKRVEGVESVKVDMLTGKVQAFLSPEHMPTREQLTEAIANTTFTLVRIDMPSGVAGN